ncbi:Ger(x)C family spore germination protein [Niallia oryzisoli]|uniref:Ger(x)C family spore germination protein n=1 Tax=Niallia oryzisoli TaxID=1737571 RepID=UPI00373653FC
MNRKIIGLISIMILLISTGCWNRRELNEIALVVGMSIDKQEENYLVTVQVVDPGEVASQKGGGGRTPVTTYSSTGTHIFEAIRRMTTVTPRRLYFAHLQMFIVSEAIAKEGISNVLELIYRDPEFRKDFFIVVTQDVKAKEILENLTSLDKIPAIKMHSSLEASEKSWAPTVAVQMDELISALTNDGKNPVLTGITIIGDQEKGETKENVEKIDAYARLKYRNIAVFKKDKLVGWLNEKESKGFNFILGNVKSTVGKIPCPEKGEVILEIVDSKVKVKGEVVNGKPKIYINIFAETNIGEVACHLDLTKPNTITLLEEEANKVNEDILHTVVTKAKTLNSDIFGFGEIIHRADPEAWNSLKKDWDNEFKNLDVSVHVEYKIRRTGVVNQSFLEKEE